MRGFFAQLLAKDSADVDLNFELSVLVAAYNTSLRGKARCAAGSAAAGTHVGVHSGVPWYFCMLCKHMLSCDTDVAAVCSNKLQRVLPCVQKLQQCKVVASTSVQ